VSEFVHALIMLERSSIVNSANRNVAIFFSLTSAFILGEFVLWPVFPGVWSEWYNLDMSQPEHEPSHRPPDGAEITPLVRALAVQFHPPIKLDKKKGLEFAPKLASAIDPREVSLEESRWLFSQPMGENTAGRFLIGVRESQLSIEAMFPAESEEMFENRARVILKEFSKLFTPEVMLGSSAMIRATLPVDGDARTFLARDITKLEPERLEPLGRPVHLLGIRLFMPPFQYEKRVSPTKPASSASKGKKKPSKTVSTIDWMVDVKAESMIEDTSKLFLEADARWQPPQEWNDKVCEEIVQRLGIVSNFLKANFIKFLTSQPKSEGE
jgi:hypothetical protein